MTGKEKKPKIHASFEDLVEESWPSVPAGWLCVTDIHKLVNKDREKEIPFTTLDGALKRAYNKGEIDSIRVGGKRYYPSKEAIK